MPRRAWRGSFSGGHFAVPSDFILNDVRHAAAPNTRFGSRYRSFFARVPRRARRGSFSGGHFAVPLDFILNDSLSRIL